MDNVEKIEDKLNEFETFYSNLKQETKLYLYRVVSGTTRFLAKFNTLPDIEDIAETYGGGTYQLALKYKDTDCSWKTKTQTVHIDMCVNSPVIQSPQNPIDGSILLVEKMLSALSPLIKPQQQVNNQEAQNEMMNKMMLSNFKAQQELFNNFIRSNQTEYYEDDDPQETDQEVPEWLTTIGGLIDEYLPDLLGEGMGSKLLVQLIHKNKQFKEISNDENKSAVLIEYMKKQIGEEKTQAIIDKLFDGK